MKIRLSPRLQCIADYVLPGSCVMDVGTDHAYIPIWLLQNGISTTAYASDLRRGPLENAAKDADAAGVSESLCLQLCDGLSQCPQDTVDTIIIAGMGGETIRDILASAPWTTAKRLILQPQTKFYELRSFLSENGFRMEDASLVYDTGRIYRVWLIGAGASEDSGWIEAPLLRKQDPLLKPYTEDLIKRLRSQIQGLERASTRDPALLQQLRSELAEYIRIHKEAESWQP